MSHKILVLLVKPKPVLVPGIFSLPLLYHPWAELGAELGFTGGCWRGRCSDSDAMACVFSFFFFSSLSFGDL